MNLTPLEQALRNAPKPRMNDDIKNQHLRMIADAQGGSTAGQSGRWYRRPAAVVAAILCGVTLPATAAVAWLESGPPSEPDIARCFAIATDYETHDPSDVAVSFGWANSSSEHATAASEAISVCSDMWQAGVVSSTPPYIDGRIAGRLRGTEPVPDLTACITPDGAVAVFPNTTCATLRLPVADLSRSAPDAQ